MKHTSKCDLYTNQAHPSDLYTSQTHLTCDLYIAKQIVWNSWFVFDMFSIEELAG
jgi:hypothetical protein